MTTTQIALVQSTWKQVASANAPTVGSALYNRLLEIMPELQIEDVATMGKEPSRKVLTLISYIVRKLHRPDTILDELEGFTRRHIQHNMHDEQYILAGRSLLQVLSKGLGDKWNDDTEHAWADCFTTVAETIMNVSRQQHQETIYYC